MNNKKLAVLIAAAAVLGAAPQSQAQSADALIDKLVEKGVLTVREANELREEADKGFSQAYSVKSGLPDYVTSLKLYGDVRIRYEGFYSGVSYTNAAGSQEFVDRHRARFRLRFGTTVTLLDNLEAGFRLTSSERTGDFGGDPISGNTTFQDNGSKKFIFIDQAYGKWTPLNGPTWMLSLIGGKMESPFVFDDLVMDPDYTPEGAAIQAGYRINDKHSLKLNAGGFMLDEFGSDRQDPYMLIGQVRWEASLNQKLSAAVGASVLTIQEPELLANTAVPNVSRGNTRNGGVLVYDYNPYVIDATLTYTLDSAPYHNGSFPIRVTGTFLENPGADDDADNYGWTAGVVFGKASKKKTWEVSYNYKWLGANSWYEELVDSDFGAFYGAVNSPPGSGSNVGFGSGTNVRGHIFRLAYAPADSLVLSAKWFLTDLIESYPAATESDMNRLQVDAAWKF